MCRPCWLATNKLKFYNKQLVVGKIMLHNSCVRLFKNGKRFKKPGQNYHTEY